MNTVINDLFRHATDKDIPTGVDSFHGREIQTFAQLLIQECIAKISVEQDSADQNWQCKNGVHIAHELKKHFGV